MWRFLKKMLKRKRGPAGPPTPGEIKLAAIDIDGTLLRSDQRITRRVADAVQQAADQGTRVMMVTARGPEGVGWLLKLLPVDKAVIYFNGAYTRRESDGHVLRHKSVSADLALSIAQLARSIHAGVQIRVDVEGVWYTDRWYRSGKSAPGQAPPAEVAPLEQILNREITRLTFLAKAEAIREIHEAVRERYGDQIDIPATDERILQVAHPDANKASALEEIVADYGLTSDQTIAIGNAPNDTSMFAWSRWAVAVDNAREWEGVLEAAHAVVASNNQNGVAEALEKFVIRDAPRKKSGDSRKSSGSGQKGRGSRQHGSSKKSSHDSRDAHSAGTE